MSLLFWVLSKGGYATASLVCTSFLTCQSRYAGRGERITEAALYWNEDKRAGMAQSLAGRSALELFGLTVRLHP